MLTDLQKFLKSQPLNDGIYEISSSRGFQHDEGDYDRQYGLDKIEPEILRREAGEILNVCRLHGFEKGATVLEIGCGTGRLSIGLALQPDVGHLFLTDPSPAFCRIVQKKLAGIAASAEQVDIGILQAEDLGTFSAGSVSLILLRSVLHHFSDVDGFLRACSTVLSSGGILLCQEPYYEGYMMMGFAGQFIESALAATGYICTPEEQQRIAIFVAAMQFYCRRDIDKSNAEDKHLFRPDELMVTGRLIGLELTHYPDGVPYSPPEGDGSARVGRFHKFFTNYLHYCMDWPIDFSDQVSKATAKYFDFFEPMERAGDTAPYLFGTFVFVKR